MTLLALIGFYLSNADQTSQRTTMTISPEVERTQP